MTTILEPVEQSRADFEMWAKSIGDNFFPDLSREGDGYWQQRTNTAWLAWKAAKSLVDAHNYVEPQQ